MLLQPHIQALLNALVQGVRNAGEDVDAVSYAYATGHRLTKALTDVVLEWIHTYCRCKPYFR